MLSFSNEDTFEILDRADQLSLRLQELKSLVENEPEGERKQYMLDDFRFILDKIDESLKWFGG